MEGATRDVLRSARVAIVASGTATVETALTLTPMVVVYRLSALTYALGKPLVSVSNYAMVNLIAGRVVVPELIQGDFTPARVTAETLRILDDGAPRAGMLKSLKCGRNSARAAPPGTPPPRSAYFYLSDVPGAGSRAAPGAG